MESWTDLTLLARLRKGGGSETGELPEFAHEMRLEPDTEIRCRFYDSVGNTLDHTYEPLDDDTVRIWAGDKGSPAYAISTMSSDGKTLSAEWVYPGGGGYQTKGTRVS